jgi:glyoxylase-like metal-dependent hydrolase (beta-lactamase superfamily II)
MTVPRPIKQRCSNTLLPFPEERLVTITPFVDEGLGNSSYLVEIGDRRGLVVDPPRDIRPFLTHAAAHRIRFSYSLETHLHADFVSGSRELAAGGAQILAPRDARLAYGHTGLEDDEDFDLGGLRLQPIATPGHTPEHLGYLLLDGDRPVALFSGGALLPGGVARTDLIAPEQTEPLARSLYRALQRVLVLPDEVPVYSGVGLDVSGPQRRSWAANRRNEQLISAGVCIGPPNTVALRIGRKTWLAQPPAPPLLAVAGRLEIRRPKRRNCAVPGRGKKVVVAGVRSHQPLLAIAAGMHDG